MRYLKRTLWKHRWRLAATGRYTLFWKLKSFPLRASISIVWRPIFPLLISRPLNKCPGGAEVLESATVYILAFFLSFYPPMAATIYFHDFFLRSSPVIPAHGVQIGWNYNDTCFNLLNFSYLMKKFPNFYLSPELRNFLDLFNSLWNLFFEFLTTRLTVF